MSWWQILALFPVGIVAGWLNVMAGGGSLLSIPAMLFFGMEGPTANGTNRISIIAQNMTAVSTFRRRGFSDFRLSLSLAAAASVGAVFGAHFGTRLDGPWFSRVVAIVMIAVLVLMAFGGEKRLAEDGRKDGKAKNLVAGHLLMTVAGIWGGFIQIGVGFIMMPILSRVMGLDLVRVNMHKVFIALVYSIVALAIFASRVELMWLAGLSLAAGNSVGGWLGAHFTVSRGEALVRRVFMLAIMALIVKLLFFP